MSNNDGEAKRWRAVGNGSEGTKPLWLGLSVIVVIVLAVIAVVMMAGLQRSSMKGIVLQAEDMGNITGLDGNWAQDHFIDSDESTGSSRYCLSQMTVSNGTNAQMITIWVYDMRSPIEAGQKYDELVASNQNLINTTQLGVGEAGILDGAFVPEDGPVSGAFLCYCQGNYCVQMVFMGNMTTKALCTEVAQAQADLLSGP